VDDPGCAPSNTQVGEQRRLLQYRVPGPPLRRATTAVARRSASARWRQLSIAARPVSGVMPEESVAFVGARGRRKRRPRRRAPSEDAVLWRTATCQSASPREPKIQWRRAAPRGGHAEIDGARSPCCTGASSWASAHAAAISGRTPEATHIPRLAPHWWRKASVREHPVFLADLPYPPSA
jgi:hypothetical protein